MGRIYELISGSLLLAAASLLFIDTVDAQLQLHQSNPRYFTDDDNTILLIGGANIAPSLLPIDAVSSYRAQLDKQSSNGANYGRIWSVLPWEGTSALYPWARSGSGQANDGGYRFNLTEWDQDYWEILKEAIKYADTKGIYLQYMVFDEVGLEQASNRWNQHPFNPDNNINYLALPSGNVRAVEHYYNLDNPRLLALQEAYVDKLLEETCSYGNLIYEISNETTAPWPWQRHFIDYIDERCPRLIANNPFSHQAENLNYPTLDIVNFHNLSAQIANARLNSEHAREKALKYDEQALGVHSPAELRRIGWGTILAGGHLNWDESGNNEAEEHTTRSINQFLSVIDIDFSMMEPDNSVVEHGYALINPGEAYVIYSPTPGPIAIDLSTLATPANISWYDPRTAAFIESSLVIDRQSITLDPPVPGDFVLYVASARQQQGAE